MDELNGKRKENADVKSDVKQREKELRFQVSLKSREVTAERTKTNINMEEIKEKQVESHKIWMKKQLDELREMYEKQKVDVAATMRDMYVQKVKIVNFVVSPPKSAQIQLCEKSNL